MLPLKPLSVQDTTRNLKLTLGSRNMAVWTFEGGAKMQVYDFKTMNAILRQMDENMIF